MIRDVPSMIRDVPSMIGDVLLSAHVGVGRESEAGWLGCTDVASRCLQFLPLPT